MVKTIENDSFCIPLYHGTSSLFQASIQKHGLGAINPLLKYSVPSFLKQAFDVCNKALAGDQEWELCKMAPSWIITQESFRDSANFQHGNTYLTPSRSRAVSYALTYKYGSEMLSVGHKLFILATKRCPDLVKETGLDQHPVLDLLNTNHSPILVVAHKVPLSYLLSEGGDAPQQTISKLEEYYSLFSNININWDININFRLRVPLTSASFLIEPIDPEKERNLFD